MFLSFLEISVCCKKYWQHLKLPCILVTFFASKLCSLWTLTAEPCTHTSGVFILIIPITSSRLKFWKGNICFLHLFLSVLLIYTHQLKYNYLYRPYIYLAYVYWVYLRNMIHPIHFIQDNFRISKRWRNQPAIKKILQTKATVIKITP